MKFNILRNTVSHFIVGCTLLLLLLGRAQATIYYVSNGGFPSNSGLSWSSPKSSLQSTINNANSGDQVWVEAGTFQGPFIAKDGVGVYGGFAGTETSVSQRNLTLNQTALVVSSVGATTYTIPSNAVGANTIDGFVINSSQASVTNVGGIADLGQDSLTIANCQVYAVISGITINQNCHTCLISGCTISNDYVGITDNQASGTVAIAGAQLSANSKTSVKFSLFNGTANITDSIFSNSLGPTILADQSPGTINATRCTFNNGSSTFFQSQAYLGGITTNQGTLNISSCSFNNNSDEFVGGSSGLSATSATINISNSDFLSGQSNAVLLKSCPSVTVTGCQFENNAGGGIVANNSTLVVSKSSFINNTLILNGQTATGSGIELTDDSATVSQCKFYQNTPDAVNLQYPSGGSGAVGSSSLSDTIKDNLIIGSGAFGTEPNGIDIGGSNTSYSSEIINDSILSSYDGLSVSASSGLVYVANSIFYENSIGVANSLTTHLPIITSHNDSYANQLNYQGFTVNLTDLQIDPKFAHSTTDDSPLSPTSPLLNTGDIGYVSPSDTDVLGTVRLNGSHVDIGAYESSLSEYKGVAFDWDGNGYSDLLWQNKTTGAFTVWSLEDTQELRYIPVFPGASAPWTVVGTPDINGDGHPDILWWNSSTGQLYVWLMNDTTFLSGISIQGDPNTSNVPVATGNIDGLGDWSLVWENSATGKIYRWKMLGTFVNTTQGNSYTVDPSWHVVAFTDFDGDGNSDLLFWNSNSGYVITWLMSDDQVLHYGTAFTQVPDTTWHLIGAPDLNSDGHPDLLWQNTNTGLVIRWQMNYQTELSSAFYPYTYGITGWNVVGMK